MDRQERDRQTRARIAWQLNRVDDIEWTQDRSGVFVYINWNMSTDSVRLDIVRERDSQPLQSFAGTADNVRKHAVRWLVDNIGLASSVHGLSQIGILAEHISYIGAELARCGAERIDYIQD